MSYAVKSVYYTIQGEGMNAGRAAVFLRFSGCNLWSGREQDRGKGAGGCSQWCDTDFVGVDGVGGGRYETPQALVRAVSEAWPEAPRSKRLVVCTGGEPLLQLDEPLVETLHAEGFEVAIETNGTKLPPAGVDWVCVSPKAGTSLALTTGNELKLVFPQVGAEPERFDHLDFETFLLQPMDGPAVEENMRLTLQYCLEHPRWRLGIQAHKFWGIP